ncbi:MAG: ArsR family transcriptional regulator [Hyphomicrobiales bacterium]|nr:MAG: ArsR family transcriptional regulator [Hyphomicrobiales bacterium]
MKDRLDSIDWKILGELQCNGRMTNVELAKRVGISAPPCLRRVRTLEENGVIEGYRTLLNANALGYQLIAFAYVGLSSQGEAELQAFQKSVKSWDIVRECYLLSGDVDFILKCVAKDLQSFQSFIVNELTAADHVESIRTSLTISKVKDEPRVPIE